MLSRQGLKRRGSISQVLGGTGKRGGLINRRVNAGLLTYTRQCQRK